MADAQGSGNVAPSADPKDLIAWAKAKGLVMVDLKFIDLPGLWQHFSMPIRGLTEGLFTDGVGFDGSSIRGFQQIHESDMLLMPDPAPRLWTDLQGANVEPGLQHRGPDYPRAVIARSPLRGPKGGAVSPDNRTCRHELLGAGSGVLYLQVPALWPDANSGSTTSIRKRVSGIAAQKDAQLPGWGQQPQPRFPPPLQGRLLPGATDG